jgi:D-alanine-D-alanine ligase
VEFINKLLEKATESINNTTIVLVTNVDGRTKEFNDYSSSSVVSEYLSELELEKLVEGFQTFGFKTSVYYDEAHFIKDIVLGNQSAYHRSLIVINMAQKGTKIGRKSLVPAFCQLFDLRYVNSNPYVVSLCRDKYFTGVILDQHEIATPSSWLYNKNGWLLGKKPLSGSRIIIKLNHESASIGMDGNNVLVYSDKQDRYLKQMAFEYNQDLIVQEFIVGFEVEVPFIHHKQTECLLPIGIKLSDDPFLGEQILTYEIRGKDKYSFYNYSTLNPSLADQLLQTTKQTAELLNIQGFGRIDYRIDATGRWYIIDIATSPHIVRHSSFYTAFQIKGYTYTQMLAVLAGLAIYDSDQN